MYRPPSQTTIPRLRAALKRPGPTTPELAKPSTPSPLLDPTGHPTCFGSLEFVDPAQAPGLQGPYRCSFAESTKQIVFCICDVGSPVGNV